MLNLLLADEYVRYATTRDYHWNVTDPEFSSLHLQFEIQFGQIAKWIDHVAERARSIGIGLPAEHMLAELLALHEDMIVQLRKDGQTCTERFNDVAAADFLTGLIGQHEKAA